MSNRDKEAKAQSNKGPGFKPMHECTNCGWIGTHEEKKEQRDLKVDYRAWDHVCPDCGHNEFFTNPKTQWK